MHPAVTLRPVVITLCPCARPCLQIHVLADERKQWSDKVAAGERRIAIAEEENRRLREENERLRDELRFLRTEVRRGGCRPAPLPLPELAGFRVGGF